MKTQNSLSALLICGVLLTIGCARTSPSSTAKPAPQNGAPAQRAPEAPVTDGLDLSAGTTSAPQGGDDAANDRAGGAFTGEVEGAPLSANTNTAAGTLTIVGAGSMTAQPEPVTVDEIVVVATKEQVQRAKILGFVEDLKLPVVAPFAKPKFTDKEVARFFVGQKCSSVVSLAKRVGGVGNLASKLPSNLCNTLPLQRGSPKVMVVPGKYISRNTGENWLFESNVQNVEVLLRSNGSVAAIRTSTRSRGFFSKSAKDRIEAATPRGDRLVSESEAGRETLVMENRDKSIRYEAKTKRSTKHSPTVTEKSLVAKNYQGMNLSVVEKSESQYSNASGRIVRSSVTCNLILLDKNLTTVFSSTIDDRCFHRR